MSVCAGFVLHGVVDGRPCVAKWSGDQLEADAELLRRAEVVIALGETFTCDDLPRQIPASLDDGLPMMLTLVRAFSRVTSVELQVLRRKGHRLQGRSRRHPRDDP
jgi:hypothetical protein